MVVFLMFFLFPRIQSFPLTFASLLEKKNPISAFLITLNYTTLTRIHKHTVIVYYAPESMPSTGTVILIMLFLFVILLLTIKVNCFSHY